jgi:sigma-B regulation protein RsbU (phosphoserine phosphatase)
MIYGILDTETSTFTYSNGGHCYPLHWNNTRNIEVLKTGGMLIGAFEEATFTTGTCLLAPGDILVFYTDGITETEAGDDPVSDGNHGVSTSSEQSDVYQDAILTDTFYGSDRLAICLSKNAALSASALCEAVVNDLAIFSGSTQTHDDRALIVIKRDV